MRTRNSYFPNNSNVTIPRRRNKGRAPNIVEPELRTIVAPMAERTMEELLRAPTEGYGEAIVLPEINADHFEIKTNLLQLVQANPFYGRESENPHAHINSFKRITSTLRFRNVPNDVIKLMMFPYSLEGAAKTWYEKEPPNSILTWEDLVTKFVNQFFPPSKTTHLKNEISRFTQKFEETFSEAWERFKENASRALSVSAEEIVPIPRESKDTTRSDSKNVLPSCYDFSSINVPRDDFVTFSNLLFEFDVNFNSSDINPLFDEVLEDIEYKDSNDSNLDEAIFLITPLSDSNKDECLALGDDIEILLHHDPSTPMKSVASILEGFIDDPPFEENDDLFDLECKTNDWKRILYDAPIDEVECFDPGGDNDEINAFLAIEVPTYIEEGYYDSKGD
ncbi:reverse transcriptase domain-containing protein, partial [Tanacetum coccineum]